MKHYAGLDLSMETTQVCIVDDKGGSCPAAWCKIADLRRGPRLIRRPRRVA